MFNYQDPKQLHRQVERRKQEKAEIKRISNTPTNRWLKYFTMALLVMSALSLMSIAIWLDDMPDRTMLFLRGCAGLFAILGIIIYAILMFRVNSAYQKLKDKPRRIDLPKE